MKLSGKIITGIVIVGIIYVYYRNKSMKIVLKTDESTQTDFMEPIIEELTLEQQDHKVSYEIKKEEYINTLNSIREEETTEQIIDDNHYSSEEDNQTIINYSVLELKEMAKEQKIKGYSKMKKAELIEKLEL